MPSDFGFNDDSLFDASSGSFANSDMSDPFTGSSSTANGNASGFSGGDSFGADSDAFGFGVDAFDVGNMGSMGSGGSGSGGGPRKQRQPLPAWAKLTAIIAAVLLALVGLAQIFRPQTYTISLETDPGDIIISTTTQADGTFTVSLRHQLTDLDTSQFYMAGFMMARDDQTLNAVGDPFYITSVTSYTATAEFVVRYPGTYTISFYSYSMLDDLPSLTKAHTVTLGDGTAPVLPADSAVVVIATPTPRATATATPRVTATATPRVTTPPSATATPVSRKLRPASDIFDLYDVKTRYYYNQLTDLQKDVFSTLYDGVVNTQRTIHFTPCAEEDFQRAIDALFYDCPELFLLDYELHTYYYTYDGRHQFLSVDFGDDYYRLSASAYRSQLDEVMQIIRSLRNLPGFGSSDYSKELAITNYIVEKARYDKNLPNCAYADSVYLHGYAKCTGYTCALNLALRYYGIPCASVIGNTYDNGVISPTSHMWSLVEIGGQWYHCDATWNDSSSYLTQAFPYLNLSDSLMLAARKLDSDTNFRLPNCNSINQSYAMKDGVYVRAGSDIADTIARHIVDAYRSGDSEVLFLFESAADVSTAIIMFKNGSISNSISKLMNRQLPCSMFKYPDVNTLKFHLK